MSANQHAHHAPTGNGEHAAHTAHRDHEMHNDHAAPANFACLARQACLHRHARSTRGTGNACGVRSSSRVNRHQPLRHFAGRLPPSAPLGQVARHLLRQRACLLHLAALPHRQTRPVVDARSVQRTARDCTQTGAQSTPRSFVQAAQGHALKYPSTATVKRLPCLVNFWRSS